jgi:hypothetical protein
MSTKKKSTPKASEPKPKYSIGGKVFFINYPGGKPEILEAEIESIQSTKFPEKDGLGKTRGYTTHFDYAVTTKRGDMEINELNLFPNFQSVANDFAKGFLYLLK